MCAEWIHIWLTIIFLFHFALVSGIDLFSSAFSFFGKRVKKICKNTSLNNFWYSYDIFDLLESWIRFYMQCCWLSFDLKETLRNFRWVLATAASAARSCNYKTLVYNVLLISEPRGDHTILTGEKRHLKDKRQRTVPMLSDFESVISR